MSNSTKYVFLKTTSAHHTCHETIYMQYINSLWFDLEFLFKQMPSA